MEVFRRSYPLNGKQSHCAPKAPPYAESYHTTYRSLRSIHPFCTAHHFTQSPKSYALHWTRHSPKSAAPHWGIGTVTIPSNTWFFGSTRLSIPHGISISSISPSMFTILLLRYNLYCLSSSVQKCGNFKSIMCVIFVLSHCASCKISLR